MTTQAVFRKSSWRKERRICFTVFLHGQICQKRAASLVQAHKISPEMRGAVDSTAGMTCGIIGVMPVPAYAAEIRRRQTIPVCDP
jgi:hypothetical protein